MPVHVRTIDRHHHGLSRRRGHNVTIYEQSRSLDFGTEKKEPTKDFDKVMTLICQMAIPSR